MLYRWKEQAEQRKAGMNLSEDELSEFKSLRQEVKNLRVEKEILKKSSAFCLLRKRNEVKFSFIKCNSELTLTHYMCTAELKSYLTIVVKVGGSRELMKKLREEGFQVGRCKVCRLMKKLGLFVTQRLA